MIEELWTDETVTVTHVLTQTYLRKICLARQHTLELGQKETFETVVLLKCASIVNHVMVHI